MSHDSFRGETRRLPSNFACTCLSVPAGEWRGNVEEFRASGARFLTLWGADDRHRDGCFHVYAAFLLPKGIAVLKHRAEGRPEPQYPSLADLFPSALRMERALHDLLGVASTAPDGRGWLRHSGWPDFVFPLRKDVDGRQQYDNVPEPYPFVQVEGDGVHEIPVGPVHAGTIEPGHFRFSVVGEKVLRVEERLGYTHKGVAKRFEEMNQGEGHRLAARLSGDSSVAYSWAYCAALEAIAQAPCPPRAAVLRALALEHERVANHLGDLGALGNDAGFAFGLTQFSRLKEDLLRRNAAVFGARYLLDYVAPGGVTGDLPFGMDGQLRDHYVLLGSEVTRLRSIYVEHAGVQDRFRDAGRLSRETAERLDAIGLAARASGLSQDLRVTHPWPPYDRLQPKLAVRTPGDVAARAQVRFDEIFESLRLCRRLLDALPPGPFRNEVPVTDPDVLGIGLIEGWRGPVLVALETGSRGTIRRCHASDPSWQNWPLLEYAILGNIVPDFPLINKSFNLSYSGQDG